MKVFVFGSNQSGRHGKGAALTALKEYGAIYGVGEGPTGNAYAIPTKDRSMKPRTLDAIEQSVYTFLAFARAHPELEFLVTRIGCGLAGYTASEIAPMFVGAPDNCELPAGWRLYRRDAE